MILTLEESVELDLLPGWRELPPARVLATDDWMWEWVECTEVACDRRERFTAALGRASQFVREVGASERLWMIVSDPSGPPERMAVAAVSVVSRDDVAVVPESLIDGLHVFAREERSLALPVGELHSIHDLVVVPDRGIPILGERYVGWLTREEHQPIVRLELLCGSVDAFTDLLALGESALVGTRTL
jgi:hypothetical protein